jgi:hypothetical protein
VKHPERVEDYLDHIVEGITRATDYLGGVRDFEAFQRDPRTQDAIIRNIEHPPAPSQCLCNDRRARRYGRHRDQP